MPARSRWPRPLHDCASTGARQHDNDTASCDAALLPVNELATAAGGAGTAKHQRVSPSTVASRVHHAVGDSGSRTRRSYSFNRAPCAGRPGTFLPLAPRAMSSGDSTTLVGVGLACGFTLSAHVRDTVSAAGVSADPYEGLSVRETLAPSEVGNKLA